MLGMDGGSRGLGSFLREARQRRHLTVREASRRARMRGASVSPATITRVEQGLRRPGERRLEALLAVYHVPARFVRDLLDLERFAVDLPASDSPDELCERGIRHWRAGELAEGTACLVKARMTSTGKTRHRVTLAFAVVAKGIGKIGLARHLLEGLIAEQPDRDTLCRALMAIASAYREMGALQLALGAADQALAHADAPRLAGWALHQRAHVLLDLGELDRAEKDIRSAIAELRQEGDAMDVDRAHRALVLILVARGRIDDALATSAHAGGLAPARALRAAGRRQESIAAIRDYLTSGEITPFDRFLALYEMWKSDGRKETTREQALAALEPLDNESSMIEAAKQELLGD